MKLPKHWGALVVVFSCKIHAVTDALSLSVHFILTRGQAAVDALGPRVRWPLSAGQVADVTRALVLIERIETQAVLADKAYDANHLLKRLAQRNIQAVFPPEANRTEQRQYDQLCA